MLISGKISKLSRLQACFVFFVTALGYSDCPFVGFSEVTSREYTVIVISTNPDSEAISRSHTFIIDTPVSFHEAVSREFTIIDEAIVGDLNGDNEVNIDDLTALLSSFGLATDLGIAGGDLNLNGLVDLSDLAELLSKFGTICP